MYATYKRHTRIDCRGNPIPGWLTVRVHVTDPADFHDAIRFKLVSSKNFVVSLINRPARETWQSAKETGATFKMQPRDDFEKFEKLFRVTLDALEDQLAGKRAEERDAARILPPLRYATVA